jgi:hypothetical protein
VFFIRWPKYAAFQVVGAEGPSPNKKKVSMRKRLSSFCCKVPFPPPLPPYRNEKRALQNSVLNQACALIRRIINSSMVKSISLNRRFALICIAS